jgi:ribonuclease VapC
MFVDASAMLAILLEEADGKLLAEALERGTSPRKVTSVVAVWEAAVGLYRKKQIPMAEAEGRLRDFLTQAGVEVIPLSMEELSAALLAFDRYGRHRYSDAERNRALNLADCFHYACAKGRGLPILHKDQGLALTDLPNVS